MTGYLESGRKEACFGCEACANACQKNAITMEEDEEGFRYPVTDSQLCIGCGTCRQVCPAACKPFRYGSDQYVFGGYSLDRKVRFESTSGGAFSVIADAFCDENYVIFGARAKGLFVYHDYITDKRLLNRFRKSKYAQSAVGMAYRKTKQFLKEGKKVLFSGTPCQIAGLRAYLGNTNQQCLLTIEVICEGVPSPLYMRKLDRYIQKKYGSGIKKLDYRYKGKPLIGQGRWDFQGMKMKFPFVRNCPGGRWDFEEMKIVIKRHAGIRIIKKDRWFNPFWSVWLDHLMSRPCCYECPFTTTERVADITLGDLWGVHIYCPELYGESSF